jgi:DNA-binding MarR family transcriptional regulator
MTKAIRLFESYEWVGEIANKTIVELKKTADILEEIHNRFFNRYQISSTKFNLLVVLYNGPEEGLMLSEIGESMLVTRANITGLIDRLEKQGYVIRKRDPDDRRKIMALITQEGKKFIEKIMLEYKNWSRDVMGVLDDKQKEDLVYYLKKMQFLLIQKNLV